MKKSLFLLFLLIFLSVSFLYAGGEKEKKEEVVHLNVIGVNDPYWPELEKLLPLFTEKTGIEVSMEGTGYDEAYNKITLDLTSNTANYDVIEVDSPWNPEYAENGLISVLDPYIERDRDDLRPDDIIGWGAGTWKGQQTAIPVSPFVSVMYYRKDIFDQHGFKPPKTWDDLYRIGKKLTMDTDNDGKVDFWGFAYGNAKGMCISQIWETQYITAGGAFWRDYAAGDFYPLLDKSLAKKVTERFYKFLEIAPPNNINFDWHDAVNEFMQGRVAVVVPWDIYSGDFENPEKSVIMGKWAASETPSEDGTYGPYSVPWNLGINADTPHQDESWEFIKWVISDDCQKRLTDTGSTPPNRFSLLDYPKYHELFPTAPVQKIQLVKGALPWPYVTKSAKIEEEIMGLHLNEMQAGHLSVDEALRIMQKEIVELMESE